MIENILKNFKLPDNLSSKEQQQYSNLSSDNTIRYIEAVEQYRQGNSYNNINPIGMREVLAHRFGMLKIEQYQWEEDNKQANLSRRYIR